MRYMKNAINLAQRRADRTGVTYIVFRYTDTGEFSFMSAGMWKIYGANGERLYRRTIEPAKKERAR
jgi:hypothetical protein